jgi:hypothetical protein
VEFFKNETLEKIEENMDKKLETIPQEEDIQKE